MSQKIRHALLRRSIELLEQEGALNIRFRYGSKHIVLSAEIRGGRQVNTTLSKSPHSGDWRLARNHFAQLRRQLRTAEKNGA